MQAAALNVQQKSVTENQALNRFTSTQQLELHHSQHPPQPTVEIGLLSCFVGSFLLAIVLLIQRRKHRVRVHQQRILMLERLWKLSVQKQS